MAALTGVSPHPPGGIDGPGQSGRRCATRVPQQKAAQEAIGDRVRGRLNHPTPHEPLRVPGGTGGWNEDTLTGAVSPSLLGMTLVDRPGLPSRGARRR
jgi:hypothetical protein